MSLPSLLSTKNPSFPANSIEQDITYGNTAQKSAIPKAGDIYVDVEADVYYVCFADGTWSALSTTTHTHDTLPEDVNLTGVITPPQITSNQDDYNPTGLSTATILRLSTNSSARQLQGIAGGTSGRVLIIQMTGSNGLVLTDEAGGSTAANRISCENSTGIVIPPDGMAILIYDGTESRWKVLPSLPIHTHVDSTIGGTIDHGALTGLTDDDHTQYRLESADHTHQSTGLQGGVIYAYKTYEFFPSVAIDEDIVAGDRQDWHHSGPLDETVISIISDFITAPGTNIVYELEYASSNTFDGSPTWTEIDSITHLSSDGITLETTSSFTNSTITANRIIRFNVASTSGTAPQNGKITLRTRSLIPIA